MAWCILLAVAIVVLVAIIMIAYGVYLEIRGVNDSFWSFTGLLQLLFGLPIMSGLGAIGSIILWYAGLASLISMMVTSGILLVIAIIGAVVIWIIYKM